MRRINPLLSNYQPLENRRLLAGDVSVAVSDSVLNIVGDTLANEIQVSQDDNGSIVVSGIDTTVNNGSSSVTVAESFRFISLFMGDGNDSVSLDSVTVNLNISFFGDAGNDRLTASDTTARHLHAEGGDGNDVFDLDMRTRKSAYLYLGDGDDTVALNTFNAGRNFKIFAGTGNDTIASDTLGAGRRLEIELEEGNDSFVVAGTTSVRQAAMINAGDGNDFVATNPGDSESIQFRSRLELDAGIGDDNISIGEATSIGSSVSLEGGDGSDSILQSGLSSFEVSGFENVEIANFQTLLDGVFTTLNNSGINAAPFGGVSQNGPLSITIDQTTLTFSEGDEPLSVADDLTISGGDSDSAISGATVTVEGFAAGQDVLEFENTTTLAASFDDQTGILSLSGTDSSETYESVLRTVTFDNTSTSPLTDQRTIQFSVSTSDETATASRILNVVAANSAPVVDFNNSTRQVSLSELPVTLDSGLVISDSDNTELSEAIVQIATNFVSNEDVLEFDAQSGINATYDPSTGTLTASGTADIADYQTFLRNVRFENSSTAAGSRTIRFTVSDGIERGSSDLTLQLSDDV